MDHNHPLPAAGSKPALFKIGKNSQGNWVAQDLSGLRGGLFVSRAEAMKFAMFENGHRPQAVIMVPTVLELNIGRKRQPVERAAAPAAEVPWQRVA